MIEDMYWTANYSSNLYKFIEAYNKEHDIFDNDSEKYLKKLMEQLYVATQNKYGVCYTIEDFLEEVERGSIIDYDGKGEWVDNCGNVIPGFIRCNKEYLSKYKPANAAYIMWYNR